MSSNEIDIEILNFFIDEAQDTLEEWETHCLQLEKKFSLESYNALFRCAHNLKGSSRSVGLLKFGDLVHKIEDLIFILKNKEVKLDPKTCHTLLQSQLMLSDWLKGLKTDSSYVVDTSDLIRMLDECCHTYGGECGVTTTDINEIKSEIKTVDNSLCVKNSQQNSKSDETIRVSKAKLDILLQHAEELSIQQSIIKHCKDHKNLDSADAHKCIDLASKIVKELQNSAMSLRMQPVKSLFQRLERTAKDVAREINKPISIELYGEDVELDKSVLEKMLDPLIHLVRNAVDHGIEQKDERISNKKSEEGLIKLIAENNPSGITLKIIDDGGGLKKDKIYSKAVKNGIISDKAKLSNDEIYQLIFRSGFSTKDENITNISGRGVGLDVVKQAVEELLGTVNISSQEGLGTTFEISLPTTVSIFDAMVVQIADSKFAIPISELVCILDYKEFPIIKTKNNSNAINLRNEIIPLEYLKDYLPRVSSGSLDYKIALVSEFRGRKIGFIIDKIIGRQVIVSRPLSGYLKNYSGISGCTILFDGEPSLIISLKDINKCYLEHYNVQGLSA